MGPDLYISQREVFVNLTDVTLSDEDINSIITEKVNRTIQGNAL